MIFASLLCCLVVNDISLAGPFQISPFKSHSRDLMDYSESELLAMVEQKIRMQQEVLEENTDTPLIHYIATAHAADLSNTLPLSFARNHSKDYGFSSKVTQFVFSGPWHETMRNLFGIFVDFQENTQFISYVHSENQDQVFKTPKLRIPTFKTSIPEEAKSGLELFLKKNVHKPKFNRPNHLQIAANIRKVALAYIAQHGDELWLAIYEQAIEALSNVNEQAMLKYVLKNPVISQSDKIASELMHNPYARFYLQEIYRAEHALRLSDLADGL
ncbi:MAG: hypothetical protein HRU09_11420 [Oligoflexales bacterium]|nr:hypothetical protein [Oligoflexales bacterium]